MLLPIHPTHCTALAELEKDIELKSDSGALNKICQDTLKPCYFDAMVKLTRLLVRAESVKMVALLLPLVADFLGAPATAGGVHIQC